MNREKEDQAILQKLGKKIRALRKEAGFTSYETFANTHEFDRRYYFEMEKGANMKLITLLKLARVHNIKLEEFFKDIG